MHHPVMPYRLLVVLCLVAVPAGALGSAPARLARTAVDGEPAILVVDSAAPRLVDPATGATLWTGVSWESVALSPDGSLYFGLAHDDRAEILAFLPGDPEPVLVSDHAPEGARVRGVSPTGNRLWLLTYADGLPSGLASLPLSTGSTAEDEYPRAYRDLGDGMLLSDGNRWYGLDVTDDRLTLVEVRFQNGAPLEARQVVDGAPVGYPLLMSPDGARIYALCYPCQTITVIDTVERTVVQTVRFDRKVSKAPACAAVLSPSGDRLYLIARDGNASLGIDVLDTATFEQVARFFPGRYFYCLAISSDGAHLYADETNALVTIDTATGDELTSVPIESDPVPPYLGLATSAG